MTSRKRLLFEASRLRSVVWSEPQTEIVVAAKKSAMASPLKKGTKALPLPKPKKAQTRPTKGNSMSRVAAICERIHGRMRCMLFMMRVVRRALAIEMARIAA